MSLVQFSRCTVTFQSKNRNVPQRNYSDRCVIELRENDFLDYIIRALDVANGNTEIFNFRLDQNRKFRFGETANDPDTVDLDDGRYDVYLFNESRQDFHTVLRSTIELLGENSTPPMILDHPQPIEINHVPVDYNHRVNRQPEPQKHDPVVTHSNAKQPMPSSNSQTKISDVIGSVRCLENAMRDGNEERAGNLAATLARAMVRISIDEKNGSPAQNPLTIRIHVEQRQENFSKNIAPLNLTAYPSSSVEDLATDLYLSHGIPVMNQYWFTNGRMLFKHQSMDSLGAKKNSVFVVLVV